MTVDDRPPLMIRLAGWCGLAATACYASFFLPLPLEILQYPALAFGPLLIVGILGLSDELASSGAEPVAVRIGRVFGIVGGALANALIVIQLANNIWHQERLAEATTETEVEAAGFIHTAVNRVQAALDVSWDVFITIAAIALGVAMISHSRFGRVMGWTGILAGALLLVLNLAAFPDGPAYAGLFDAGPILGIWFAAAFVMLLRKPGVGPDSRTGPTGGDNRVSPK